MLAPLRTAAAAVTVLAISSAALFGFTTHAAAAPGPTPLTLQLTGMASKVCPLPLNGALAVTPGEVLLRSDPLLGLLSSERVTISPAPDSADAHSSFSIAAIPASGSPMRFTRAGSYVLSWQITTLSKVPLIPPVLSLVQTGRLTISPDAQKCVVAVRVPTPTLSLPGVPNPVSSPINRLVDGLVSTVDQVAAPVNSAVGPVLGSVSQTLGTLTPTDPGSSVPGGGPQPSSTPTGQSGPATGAPPFGESSSGTGPDSGAATGADSDSALGPGAGARLAAAVGLAVGSGTAVSGRGGNTPSGSDPRNGAENAGAAAGRSEASLTRSGAAVPSSTGRRPAAAAPRTVELATDNPLGALTGWSSLVVLLALVLLSSATACYARTFLLQPGSGAGAVEAK